MTLREQIDAKQAVITKIENSQEYKVGLQSNRMANYKEVLASHKRYIELAVACGNDAVTEVEALTIISNHGRRYVSDC